MFTQIDYKTFMEEGSCTDRYEPHKQWLLYIPTQKGPGIEVSSFNMHQRYMQVRSSPC